MFVWTFDFIIGLPVALQQKLKIFGVKFSYFPLNGFLRIFGTLLCSRPTMSFRWEAIMSEVYRLSKVDICRREVKSESGEGKKTQGGRLVVNHVLITFLVSLNTKMKER